MRTSRFTAEQMAHAVAQVEAGVPLGEVCRKMGISEQTFYRWRKKFAGLMPSEAKRLKQVEEENRRLKGSVADLTLDKQMLQDVLRKMTELVAAT